MFQRLPVLLALASLPLLSQTVSNSRYAHLARGVNMDNWFQYASQLVVTAADRDQLKSAGFTCIRLPVAPEYILPNWASSSTIATNLSNLDAAIDLFLNAGMAVMLDFHADSAYVSYYFANSGAPAELISTWQMLATRYSNRNPELLFFEIMNEPTNQWTQAQWDAEQTQVLAAIHKIAPMHTVLVAPVNWSGLDALVQMTPYSDTNVIYVMHDYNPLTFTHQGAGWVGYPYELESNVPYPAYLPALQTLISQTYDSGVLSVLQQYQSDDWNASTINWQIQLAAKWAKYWGVRVVVNEFGVYKNGGLTPADSRARWLHDMTTAMTSNGLGWAMWEYESGFDLVTGQYPGYRTIDPIVSGALGLSTFTTSYPARTGSPPPFTSLRSVQVGGAPIGNGYAEGILAADLNADSLPDLVVAPINWPTLPPFPLQVFFNQGGGVMAPATFTNDVPNVEFVDVIVPGKFDRSGKLGLFLPDNGQVNSQLGVQSGLILPAAANNTLTDATANLPQQVISTIGGAAGDVNGDGVDDLVVFYDTHSVPTQLLLNDGTGKFTINTAGFPAWVSDPTRWDNQFTCGIFIPRPGQSIKDLFAAGWPGVFGRVFYNTGNGSFLNGFTIPQPAANNGPITGGCAASGDINGDGIPDLIVGYIAPSSSQPDVVQILIGNADGTFRDETAFRIGALPVSTYGLRRLQLAPANNGKDHVLILTYVGQPPVIFADQGDGIFRTTSSWNPPTSFPWVVAGADFNNDGLLDFVLGEGGTGPTMQTEFGQTAIAADGALPNGQTQAITFVPVANVSVGAAPFTLSASATSGLSVSFASNTASVCTISGNKVTILIAGGCSITASQPGNSTYSAAVPVTQSFTVGFADLTAANYYYTAINMMGQLGITTGCGSNDYCPQQAVTRYQMAIFLVRAILHTDTFSYSPTPHFTDVPVGAPGFQWIQKLYELGITAGCTASLYCPNDNVTRDQMAVFIVRARYGASAAFTYPATASFSDVPSSNQYFKWIQRLALDGITSGCGSNTYCPSSPVIRGDMAIFIMRGAFNQLLPAATPLITGISPSTLPPGATATFTVTASNTNFAQGQTSLAAIPGVTIGSVTVTSPTTLTVQLTAASNAKTQHYAILAITNSEQAVLPNGLTVQ